MNTPPCLGTAHLRRALDERETTAYRITHDCLDRIDRFDGELNAFLRTNPDAVEEAEAADRRIEAGERGPLLGIPVAVKDNLNTAGLETTCASRILDGFVPPADATAVERLRAAGAVILGKTNMDEFAMGSSTENSCARPTHNPWDPERVPGGSSGGSAVAVAAGMAPLALGSDTGGSVRQPAAFCGIPGLKPTYGRVSRFGLIAFGSSLDQIGPLARGVRDLATVLETIAGPDPRDATCRDVPVDAYVAACERGVDGLRVGLPLEYFDEGLDPQIDRRVHEAAAVLEGLGARVEEVSLPLTRYAIPTYYLIATAEASSNLARYDAVRYGRRGTSGDGPQDLPEMYRATRGAGFGAEVKRRIMLGTYALSAGYHDAFYGKASQVRTLLTRDFVRHFEAGIDLLLAPTTPTVAFPIGDRREDPLRMYLSDVYTTTANLAGLPALSVPLGTHGGGLPVGGQLIGPAFGEVSLFRAGAALERHFGVETPAWIAGRLSQTEEGTA